jgi:hypothetical protein
MSLVTSFEALLQSLRTAMTRPSFNKLVTILTGWVLSAERTVTRMLVAAGVAGAKHHSAFHRVFACARWSLDHFGLIVFGLIEHYTSGTILLSLDDTLARKRGRKMYAVGMHHDPLLSGQGKMVTSWGHNWVVLAVVVQFSNWPRRVFSLPILFRLYVNKKAAAKSRIAYRTHSDLALEMLSLMCKHRKNRHFHVVADSAYGGQQVLHHLPRNCDLTSGLKLKARLYEAPPPRRIGRRGRPRVRGAKLPSPQQMLDARTQRLSMNLYGRKNDVEVASTKGYLFSTPNRLLAIVAVEPLRQGCRRRAFYSTCHDATAEQVLAWYAQRWSLEVTFHDTKQHLGFEDPPGWSRRAVERTAPMAMLLYSFTLIWYVEEGCRHDEITLLPWYRTKCEPSFRDMLLTLRRESLKQEFLIHPHASPNSKISKTLQYLLEIAA